MVSDFSIIECARRQIAHINQTEGICGVSHVGLLNASPFIMKDIHTDVMLFKVSARFKNNECDNESTLASCACAQTSDVYINAARFRGTLTVKFVNPTHVLKRHAIYVIVKQRVVFILKF